MSDMPALQGFSVGAMVETVNWAGNQIMDVFRPISARRLVAVRVFGQGGDGFLQTALASFVLFSPERAANPAAIAISFGILLLPYSIIGPFVGVLIDRWSRRKILAIANSVRAVTMLGLALLVSHHAENAPLAMLVIISLGINRFLQAALAASIPHVVSPDQLVTANALFPTLGTVGATLAAAVGLVIQRLTGNTDATNAGLICLGIVLAVIAASFAFGIRPRDLLGPHGATIDAREKLRNVATGLLDGIVTLNSTVPTRNAMGAVLLQRFTFGAITVHILLLARNVWHIGNPDSAVVDFGIAAGCAAAGAFCAALTSAFVLRSSLESSHSTADRHNVLQSAAMFSLFAGIVVMDSALISNTRVITFIAAGLLAFSGQLLKISADTSVQRNIDDIHRGRVFSLFDMAINFALVCGITLTALSPRMAHAGTSIVVFTSALAWSAFILFRNRNRHS